MAEQRLIDGNELYGIESLLNTDIIRNSKEASWLMSQVLYDIQSMPTIDPETLPIVRQLREELELVTAERDAAIKELDEVSSAVDNLSDFIDEQIHPIVSYDIYTTLRDNADSIAIWQYESEWREQKKDK